MEKFNKIKHNRISLTGVLNDREFAKNYCEKNGSQNCCTTIFFCCQKKKSEQDSEQDSEYRLIDTSGKNSYDTL
jgi:hypothetical protein